jgi:phage-related protein
MERGQKPVRTAFAYALYQAQCGKAHPASEPPKGFGGAGVVEVCEDYDGDTYRAVYTVRFEEAIYVRHVFQKKSRSAIKTPLAEIELIKVRLKAAEDLHSAFADKEYGL